MENTVRCNIFKLRGCDSSQTRLVRSLSKRLPNRRPITGAKISCVTKLYITNQLHIPSFRSGSWYKFHNHRYMRTILHYQETWNSKNTINITLNAFYYSCDIALSVTCYIQTRSIERCVMKLLCLQLECCCSLRRCKNLTNFFLKLFFRHCCSFETKDFQLIMVGRKNFLPMQK